MNTTIETERDFDLTEIINGEKVLSPSPFRKHQRIFEVLTIDDTKYKIYSYAEGEGTVTSEVIDGLQINVTDIFE